MAAQLAGHFKYDESERPRGEPGVASKFLDFVRDSHQCVGSRLVGRIVQLGPGNSVTGTLAEHFVHGDPHQQFVQLRAGLLVLRPTAALEGFHPGGGLRVELPSARGGPAAGGRPLVPAAERHVFLTSAEYMVLNPQVISCGKANHETIYRTSSRSRCFFLSPCAHPAIHGQGFRRISKRGSRAAGGALSCTVSTGW